MLFKIPAKQPAGGDWTAYWENFLSPEEIHRLQNLPEWGQCQDAVVGYGSSNSSVNTNIRISKVAWCFPNADNQDLWHKIVHAVANINRTVFHFDLEGCYEAAQLTVYNAEDNGNYNWHVDLSPFTSEAPRKLSMSLLLSDPADFDGGKLEVKTDSDTAHVLEQRLGRAWFFPSWVLHRVSPVTRGQRKSLVLWVGGAPFR